MGCPNRIDHPLIILLMRDQRADANDLVIDVFRRLVAHCPAHFVGQFTEQVISKRKPADIGYCLNISCDHVWHVTRLGPQGAEIVAFS